MEDNLPTFLVKPNTVHVATTKQTSKSKIVPHKVVPKIVPKTKVGVEDRDPFRILGKDLSIQIISLLDISVLRKIFTVISNTSQPNV